MTTMTDKKPYRVKHELKLRQLTVQSKQQLSPSLMQIILTGEDLADFCSVGFDDHVKLFVPDPETGEYVIPSIGPQGIQFPEDKRPIARDYTPRAFDNIAKTLTLEFAIHEAGPATHWALNSQVGDDVAIAGPRGSMVIPDSYQHHILLGDETALPAIARRLAELPASAHALVLAEVNQLDDQIALHSAAQLDIHWLHRNGADIASADLFEQALQRIVLPQQDYYIWIAAELNVARHLRKRLVNDFAVDKACIKAASYWQKGSANSGQTLPDDDEK
ncbi:siderophore-interacting protein [Acinetobacter larvae]|uniref:NADPH-dependent ferric siderophore reductase n=1 Tax=Acinetobacter larvae TaxID=1789224 RepID=A0A1B2LYM6_9GAMM|nr:siderophore-interacting protein [Acinetobacter larvae]AOA58047.1 NADPH-dependent ferric siderophore reductase [Acinetobacter larvae]